MLTVLTVLIPIEMKPHSQSQRDGIILEKMFLKNPVLIDKSKMKKGKVKRLAFLFWFLEVIGYFSCFLILYD
jgi:hypothetical protein